MKITHFHPEPIESIPFLNAGTGTLPYFEDRLSVHHAMVDRLPDGLSAIVVTADLQGRECVPGVAVLPARLLGEAMPQLLIEEVFPLLDLDDPSRVAAFLAGDFYTLPGLEKRGGTGDVSSVWQAFSDHFAWVAGVAGNHDLFGKNQKTRPQCHATMHYLDGDVVEVAGLRIGGMGGIIGKTTKPQRREETDYFGTLERILSQKVDVLITHEGPCGTEAGQRGDFRIRDTLEQHAPRLVIRGHKHWPHPLAQFPSGLQVLNVDKRVVILTK
jgi:Icc-related predicted phosphoesterase